MVCTTYVCPALGIGIGIGIGIDAADSTGYRGPAWYRSNPTAHTNIGSCE